MSVMMNPYINFNDGKAEEAINFYKSVLGGELKISRYGEFGMPAADDMKNLVMHAVLETPDFHLMVSDTGPMPAVKVGDNISVSLSGEDDAALTKYFEGLSAGGTVRDELSTKPWGDKFGMLTDKFGINWLVNISVAKPAA